MKKLFLALAVTAVLLPACKEKEVALEPVPEPTWYEDEGYTRSISDMYREFEIRKGDIVLMGDNYIHKAPWAEIYADTLIKNRGISSTGVQHVLYQIDDIAAGKPAKLFVQIGNTDLDRGTSADEVVAEACKILARANKISPDTKLHFISLLSRGDENVRASVEKVNSTMKEYAGKGAFTFVDADSALTQGIDEGRFSRDGGYSLNGAGYEAFAAVLDQYVGKEHLNRAAGDKKADADNSYYGTRVSLFRSLAKPEGDVIVMLGASIVEGGLWNELFPFSPVYNRGISGDSTKGILARLDDVKAMDPEKIFLQVGRNDMGGKENIDVAACWASYEKLIKQIKKDCPDADLYVQSVFPVGRQVEYCDQFNAAAQQVNKILEAGTERYGYFYLDIWSVLADAEGYMKEEYSYDGVHLVPDGYFRWATKLLEGGGVRLIVLDASKFETK